MAWKIHSVEVKRISVDGVRFVELVEGKKKQIIKCGKTEASFAKDILLPEPHPFALNQ